jgi:hypothetical protein
LALKVALHGERNGVGKRFRWSSRFIVFSANDQEKKRRGFDAPDTRWQAERSGARQTIPRTGVKDPASSIDLESSEIIDRIGILEARGVPKRSFS